LVKGCIAVSSSMSPVHAHSCEGSGPPCSTWVSPPNGTQIGSAVFARDVIAVSANSFLVYNALCRKPLNGQRGRFEWDSWDEQNDFRRIFLNVDYFSLQCRSLVQLIKRRCSVCSQWFPTKTNRYNDRFSLCAVDASESGCGNIEIIINDGHVPCHVTQRTSSLFHASFMPKDTSVHFVAMTFNGCKVPGMRQSISSCGCFTCCTGWAKFTLIH